MQSPGSPVCNGDMRTQDAVNSPGIQRSSREAYCASIQSLQRQSAEGSQPADLWILAGAYASDSLLCENQWQIREGEDKDQNAIRRSA